MNRNLKKSITGSLLLVLLGTAAIFAGTKWLALLIPLATLVWYGAVPALGGRRN
jgi:hypothetical protein